MKSMISDEQSARFPINREGKYGYIDKNGQEVIPCQYDEAGWFSESRAWVKLGDRYGYIDVSGK